MDVIQCIGCDRSRVFVSTLAQAVDAAMNDGWAITERNPQLGMCPECFTDYMLERARQEQDSTP